MVVDIKLVQIVCLQALSTKYVLKGKPSQTQINNSQTEFIAKRKKRRQRWHRRGERDKNDQDSGPCGLTRKRIVYNWIRTSKKELELVINHRNFEHTKLSSYKKVRVQITKCTKINCRLIWATNPCVVDSNRLKTNKSAYCVSVLCATSWMVFVLCAQIKRPKAFELRNNVKRNETVRTTTTTTTTTTMAMAKAKAYCFEASSWFMKSICCLAILDCNTRCFELLRKSIKRVFFFFLFLFSFLASLLLSL